MLEVKSFEINQIKQAFHLVDSVVVKIQLNDVHQASKWTVYKSINHVVLQVNVAKHFALR